MNEKELIHWFFTVLFPVVVSGLGVYFINKNQSANLEHRLTELETASRYQRELLVEQNKRIGKHEEEQKTMYEMVQQIRTLSTYVGELRADIKEIKDNNKGGK